MLLLKLSREPIYARRMLKKAWSALLSVCANFQSEQAVMSRTEPLEFQQEVSRFVLTYQECKEILRQCS